MDLMNAGLHAAGRWLPHDARHHEEDAMVSTGSHTCRAGLVAWAATLSLLSAACGAETQGPPGSQVDPPAAAETTTTRLPAGYRLAIGWLHPAHEPATPLCVGTVVGPRLVLTAARCTEGWLPGHVGFSVGLDLDSPRATFPVGELHEHPWVDAALVVIPADVQGHVPELVPLAIHSGPLGLGVLGREVLAAGLRAPGVPGEGTAVVVSLEVLRLTRTHLDVDGRGRAEDCLDGTGGPVVGGWHDGAPRVLAVLQGGDATCQGVDSLPRLDVSAPWLLDRAFGDGLARKSQMDAVDPCEHLGYAGMCQGSAAVWCDQGRLLRLDCAQLGARCDWVDDELGFYCLER